MTPKYACGDNVLLFNDTWIIQEIIINNSDVRYKLSLGFGEELYLIIQECKLTDNIVITRQQVQAEARHNLLKLIAEEFLNEKI